MRRKIDWKEWPAGELKTADELSEFLDISLRWLVIDANRKILECITVNGSTQVFYGSGFSSATRFTKNAARRYVTERLRLNWEKKKSPLTASVE